ncbi:MAG TPA: serine hydrolase domain-containing protein [Longimicrobiales bacterium]|nr:serine hydrolase domain-containing protein [Longimicrobiales bacterium]
MTRPPRDDAPDASPPPEPTAIDRRRWLVASGTLLLGACAPATLPASPGSPAAAGSATPGAAADARPPLDGGEPDIPRLLRLASVPGLSLAVVGRGEPTLRGFGVRRAGTGEEVTADTVFEAASLSKPVFAYLVLRLESEGVLDLDRPLREYLPLPDPSDGRAAGITARHALSHTTGWTEWRFERGEPLTTRFAPGARFSYSGEGYYFLQRVVEHVTGKGIARLARERVLEPLGMRSSGYIWRPGMDAALATPHTDRGEPKESNGVRTGREFHQVAGRTGAAVEDWTGEDVERELPRVEPSMPVVPVNLPPNVAWSFLTTARDYAAFVRHLLGAPGAPPGGRAVLDRMTAPQVTINEAVRWGLGLGLETVDGRPLFWHWGDNPGFKNFVVGDAAAGSAVVAFTNGDGGMKVYERVVRALTGADHPAFLWI